MALTKISALSEVTRGYCRGSAGAVAAVEAAFLGADGRAPLGPQPLVQQLPRREAPPPAWPLGLTGARRRSALSCNAPS